MLQTKVFLKHLAPNTPIAVWVAGYSVLQGKLLIFSCVFTSSLQNWRKTNSKTTKLILLASLLQETWWCYYNANEIYSGNVLLTFKWSWSWENNLTEFICTTNLFHFLHSYICSKSYKKSCLLSLLPTSFVDFSIRIHVGSIPVLKSIFPFTTIPGLKDLFLDSVNII